MIWKDGAVCLDEEAVRKVLRLAYDRCLDRTKFICVIEEIRSHERIEDFGFDTTYDSALKALKVYFAGPPSAALLAKDGLQIGISTRVAANFKQLQEILCEWSTYMKWVTVCRWRRTSEMVEYVRSLKPAIVTSRKVAE
ncbi:hypothetical protein Q1695_008845 [Nippostrongylus brasiliensis]|nr:hypothetical protein Q1695_008845 [Nippostrongylus brasiliensis]